MTNVMTRVRHNIGDHFGPLEEAITRAPVEIPGALSKTYREKPIP